VEESRGVVWLVPASLWYQDNAIEMGGQLLRFPHTVTVVPSNVVRVKPWKSS
jgi:hypothetical protein